MLQSIHDRLLLLARELRFDARSPVDAYRMALHGSMIELAGGICVLADNEASAGVPSLYRTFLESAVELKNLLVDESYVGSMDAAYSAQMLRLLNAAKGESNAFLDLFANLPDLEDKIAAEEERLGRLRQAGRQPLRVFERFQRAGYEEIYRSIYNDLSCDVHGNIRALLNRHFELVDGEPIVSCYRNDPASTLVPELGSTAALLLETSLLLHDEYASGGSDAVRAMQGELEALAASSVVT